MAIHYSPRPFPFSETTWNTQSIVPGKNHHKSSNAPPKGSNAKCLTCHAKKQIASKCPHRTSTTEHRQEGVEGKEEEHEANSCQYGIQVVTTPYGPKGMYITTQSVDNLGVGLPVSLSRVILSVDRLQPC